MSAILRKRVSLHFLISRPTRDCTGLLHDVSLLLVHAETARDDPKTTHLHAASRCSLA